MNLSPGNIDALIFDMDGTLWNATHSYAKVWNATCQGLGIDASFSGSDLMKYMGMSLDEILEHLLGDTVNVEKSVFLKLLGENENNMMPSLGGVLYDGVSEGLTALSKRYRLFMLSNCSARGLVNFTAFTGTTCLFEGLLAQGERPVSKSENLRYMKQHYSLQNPIYVGDTQADCDQAHDASIAFAFAKWGFGTCTSADLCFDSFSSLAQHFLDQ